MMINFNLSVSIFMEILLLLVLFAIVTPVIIVCLIINTIIMILEIRALFSKSSDKKIKVQEKEVDYSEHIEEIIKITNIKDQVVKFFNKSILDMHFLNQLLEKFTDKQKKEFIDNLIIYCREQLSNKAIDSQTENNAMVTLSMAIKYNSKHFILKK